MELQRKEEDYCEREGKRVERGKGEREGREGGERGGREREVRIRGERVRRERERE